MTTREQAIELAESALNDLETYAETGLPSVYDSVDEWLWDFFADLPCEQESCNIAIDHMLRPEAWVILQNFADRVGFNITDCLKQAKVDKQYLN